MTVDSSARKDVSIVVPVYQEGAAIATFLRELREAILRFSFVRVPELIFVDDGSTDGTRETLERARSEWTVPQIRLVYRNAKGGTVSAQIAGFRECSTPFAVTMDADGQHPAGVIDSLAAAVTPEIDLVVASRKISGGGAEWDRVERRTTSEGARMLARLLLPPARRVSDPISGFFLAKRDWVAALPPPPQCYKLLLYLLAAHPKFHAREIPYQMRPRAAGESKVVGGGLQYRRRFLSELWRYRKFWAAARRTVSDVSVSR